MAAGEFEMRQVPEVVSSPANALTELPAEGRWISPTRRNLPRPKEPLTLRLFFPAVLIAAFVIWQGGAFLSLLGGRLIAFTILTVGCISAILSHLRVKTEDADDWFLPEPIVRKDEQLVDLKIYVDGMQVGQDGGVLGVDGFLLFFAGAGCSFALGSQDIDAKESFETTWNSSIQVPEGGFLLRVRHPKRKLELAILPHAEGSDLSGLLTRIQVWSGLPPATAGPRSFPPTTWPKVFQASLIDWLFADHKRGKGESPLSR